MASLYNNFGATVQSVMDIVRTITLADVGEGDEVAGEEQVQAMLDRQETIVLSYVPDYYRNNMYDIRGEIVALPGHGSNPLLLGVKCEAGTSVKLYRNYSEGENLAWCDRQVSDEWATATVDADGFTLILDGTQTPLELGADDWCVAGYTTTFPDGIKFLAHALNTYVAWLLVGSLALEVKENEENFLDMQRAESLEKLEQLSTGGKDEKTIVGIDEIDRLKLWEDKDGGADRLKGSSSRETPAFSVIDTIRGE